MRKDVWISRQESLSSGGLFSGLYNVLETLLLTKELTLEECTLLRCQEEFF